MAKERRKKDDKKLARASTKFRLYLNIDATDERFEIKNVSAGTKINELKVQVELVAGVPYLLQRLHYLDNTDLVDSSDLKENDIVSGGTIQLRSWKIWEKLINIVVKGSLHDLLALGLTMDKSWLNLDKAYYKHKVETAKEKLQTAFFIAAHRGKIDLVRVLLNLGADVNHQTSMGRTALHMAASQGNSKCIDLMLERGASIEVFDVNGKNPVNIANMWGEKDSERHLFLNQWQTRAARVNPKKSCSLMMHQRYDSTIPSWLRGEYGQIYHGNIIPPGEYSGSTLSSPLRKPPKPRGMCRDREEGRRINSSQGQTKFESLFDDFNQEEVNPECK